MLHMINRSPTQPAALQACLRAINPGDAILLIEDAVYWAKTPEIDNSGLLELASDIKLFVLETDLKARGINDQQHDTVSAINYDRFVELTEQHSACQNWN